MKKLGTLLLALGVALAIAIPVSAVELHEPHQGTTCPAGEGIALLHFVHNQHDGTGSLSDTIDITYADAAGAETTVMDVPATKANRGTVHYTVVVDSGFTTLVNAFDSIDVGNLVLSDYECKKLPTPPKK